MGANLHQQIAALREMTTAELHAKYGELYGESPRSGHRDHLVKRIAWRLQMLAEGDLSQRARRRAAELACDAELRLAAPRAGQSQVSADKVAAESSPRPPARQRALPPPGTVLSRVYKGRLVEVTVLVQGFEHQGQVYSSLSAVAKAVTGQHWNGHRFFGLTRNRPRTTDA